MTDEIPRDEQGRFLPGKPPGPGRGPKARETRFLDAMKNEFPPEEVAAKLRKALELAEKHKSPRAMHQVLELILAYTLGKPKQTIDVGAQQDSSALIAMLMQQSGPLLPPRERVAEVIDGQHQALLEDEQENDAT